MKIPKTFPMADKVYTVRMGRHIDDNLDTGDYDGLAWHNSRHDAMIHSGLDPQRVHETFVHEVIHCADAQYNGAARMTEAQVEGLAHGMAQFLRSVGVVFEYREQTCRTKSLART